MDLSVIIVNYNVEYFLEQCLHSVFKAAQGLEIEVFVVDNNSVDGSVAMVAKKFPQAKLMANKENLGFSKANNMAIRASSGRYVLLLNPDTLVEEDTLEKSVAFMDAHPDGGGLGVQMIDGKGRFLPESKRGLPTPSVAFYKIFGLSALFPKSRIFGRYHLGFLPADETHEVDVLSGAYMLMRRSVLDEVGLLDEAFFMYGEDIDLSYRIQMGGYKNYYLADARIIHYKGESTKKSSVNYVFVFYRAMVIFAEKHFSKRRAGMFSFFINLAIYLRAGVAIISRVVRRIALPVFDAVAIMAALIALKVGYEHYSGNDYDLRHTTIAFAAYTAIWMGAVYLNTGYDRPLRTGAIWRGLGIGTVVILVLYALLPENLRFSRALILLGAVATSLIYLVSRKLLKVLGAEKFAKDERSDYRMGIVGHPSEYARISHMIAESPQRRNRIFRIAPAGSSDGDVPHFERLQEVVDVYKPGVLVFSGSDVASHDIITAMATIERKGIDFKIAPPESLYLIGSNSVEKGGELFIMDLNAVSKPQNRRKKRIFDFSVAFILLIICPLVLPWMKSPGGLIPNMWQVLTGKKTLVGYAPQIAADEKLPTLPEGVLSPLDRVKGLNAPADTARKLNAVYARDYSVRADLAVVVAGFSSLGRR